MKMQFKAAAMIIGAVSSIALGGTAFAHGNPSVHVKKSVNVKKKTECNVNSDICDNLNHSLNKNKILSGNLDKNNILSGDNVNVPVTADVSCNALSLAAGQADTLCLGNFHKIKAGQNVGH